MTESTAIEEQKPSTSSWFSNFGLANISSSILEATTKVSAVANTFVQKSISASKENEQQTSETNKDFTSMFFFDFI